MAETEEETKRRDAIVAWLKKPKRVPANKWTTANAPGKKGEEAKTK